MKYWAFISYSSKDKATAIWLQKRLENFPIPKEFEQRELAPGEKLKKRLRPVFRDRDNLASASALGPAIAACLRTIKVSHRSLLSEFREFEMG